MKLLCCDNTLKFVLVVTRVMVRSVRACDGGSCSKITLIPQGETDRGYDLLVRTPDDKSALFCALISYSITIAHSHDPAQLDASLKVGWKTMLGMLTDTLCRTCVTTVLVDTYPRSMFFFFFFMRICFLVASYRKNSVGHTAVVDKYNFIYSKILRETLLLKKW